jgi:Sir2 family
MRVFLVTGAGVSAESGLGTFRDKGGTGIWTRFDPMKLATPEAFVRDPQEVYAFYNARRRNLITAKPNAAHFALARLETALAERGGNLTLVTQNPDGRYIVTFDGSIDGNLIQIAILVTENARERWKASTCSRAHGRSSNFSASSWAVPSGTTEAGVAARV